MVAQCRLEQGEVGRWYVVGDRFLQECPAHFNRVGAPAGERVDDANEAGGLVARLDARGLCCVEGFVESAEIGRHEVAPVLGEAVRHPCATRVVQGRKRLDRATREHQNHATQTTGCVGLSIDNDSASAISLSASVTLRRDTRNSE